MIYYSIRNENNLEKLVGKIIFHSEKGASIYTIITRQPHPIGKRIGVVVEVKGPNRIYYKSNDNKNSYVSLGGIGFICDTEKEAIALEKIRDNAKDEIESYIKEVHQVIEEQISELLKNQN